MSAETTCPLVRLRAGEGGVSTPDFLQPRQEQRLREQLC